MKKLICLGDSLTFGWGVSHGEKWLSLLAQDYGIRTVNAGLNGDTMEGMAFRFRAEILPRYFTLEERHKNLLFVMGGLNDILYSGSPSTAKTGLGTIFASGLAAGAEMMVGIPPIPIPEHVGGGFEAFFPQNPRELLEEYVRWLPAFCGAFGVPVVDFQAAFLGREEELTGPDGLHPNAKGHALMAEILAEKITAE